MGAVSFSFSHEVHKGTEPDDQHSPRGYTIYDRALPLRQASSAISPQQQEPPGYQQLQQASRYPQVLSRRHRIYFGRCTVRTRAASRTTNNYKKSIPSMSRFPFGAHMMRKEDDDDYFGSEDMPGMIGGRGGRVAADGLRPNPFSNMLSANMQRSALPNFGGMPDPFRRPFSEACQHMQGENLNIPSRMTGGSVQNPMMGETRDMQIPLMRGPMGMQNGMMNGEGMDPRAAQVMGGAGMGDQKQSTSMAQVLQQYSGPAGVPLDVAQETLSAQRHNPIFQRIMQRPGFQERAAAAGVSPVLMQMIADGRL